MYRWLWERLPGPLAIRLVLAAALVAAVLAVLLLVVFPQIEMVLPFTDVDVG